MVYTLERYHQSIDAGILTENDAIELIFGRIVEKMPVGKRHNDCVVALNRYFLLNFDREFRCQPQCSVTLLGNSEPEPDFALIDRSTYAGRARNPEGEDIRLIVEVSDSTLAYDRTVKAKLYALAALPEYWIVNLQDDQVEVYTDPDPDPGDYTTIRRYKTGNFLESPLCGRIAVAELLGTA
jgi:Uma2 family endonuclease